MNNALPDILDDLTSAEEALQKSVTSVTAMITHASATLGAIADLNQEQGLAIKAIIAANKKVLRLMRPSD